MALFLASASVGRWAWDRARDNGADQLIALQAQVGPVADMVPDVGTIVDTHWAADGVQLDVGLNVYADGVTSAANNELTSVSAPFAKAMLGLQTLIYGHGQRTITNVVSASKIVYSGLSAGDHTGLRFTQPLGIAAFMDGIVYDNFLTSASAPFTPDIEGRHVSIAGAGTRLVTAYNSATEIEVDGALMALREGVHFTMPVIMAAADRLLSAGAQIIDAHRSPATNTPMIMRWHLGA